MNPAYVIRAVVRDDLRDEFQEFMRERHIADVLATQAFFGASFYRVGPGEYLIVYETHDREALDAYLENCAPKLRSESAIAFPEGVQFIREEWTVLGSWSCGERP